MDKTRCIKFENHYCIIIEETILRYEEYEYYMSREKEWIKSSFDGGRVLVNDVSF